MCGLVRNDCIRVVQLVVCVEMTMHVVQSFVCV